jgi:hypothetical protein
MFIGWQNIGKEIAKMILNAFGGYPKRKLAAKGGIRQEYLLLYLAQCVWHYYNHRI